MKPNPDDRRDNVRKIQNNIDNTMKSIYEAEDMIKATDNCNMKAELEAKNARRRDALNSMIDEIKEEAHDKENGYK
ncbi:small acid-soluble spore protein Tlp [Clostridium sp. B9]|uniref:small acid-soluble spore protein Tlp n=1 Tax=Clostridium sp. B9 TaxID=3423224 RepID=UPI003D2F1295